MEGVRDGWIGSRRQVVRGDPGRRAIRPAPRRQAPQLAPRRQAPQLAPRRQAPQLAEPGPGWGPGAGPAAGPGRAHAAGGRGDRGQGVALQQGGRAVHRLRHESAGQERLGVRLLRDDGVRAAGGQLDLVIPAGPGEDRGDRQRLVRQHDPDPGQPGPAAGTERDELQPGVHGRDRVRGVPGRELPPGGGPQRRDQLLSAGGAALPGQPDAGDRGLLEGHDQGLRQRPAGDF